MRAFAERVFASDTKDDTIRDEISMFDVADDCPILHQEMAKHLHADDDTEKRWDQYPRSNYMVKNTFTYVQVPLKLADINTEGNLVGFHDKCFWNFDHERMKPTTNHTTSHPQQEASTQPHHGCAFRFYQEICCTYSSSGGGNAHLPGSTRLPEGGHHRRLCRRGTIYFPSSLLTFTGEFILKVIKV